MRYGRRSCGQDRDRLSQRLGKRFRSSSSCGRRLARPGMHALGKRELCGARAKRLHAEFADGGRREDGFVHVVDIEEPEPELDKPCSRRGGDGSRGDPGRATGALSGRSAGGSSASGRWLRKPGKTRTGACLRKPGTRPQPAAVSQQPGLCKTKMTGRGVQSGRRWPERVVAAAVAVSSLHWGKSSRDLRLRPVAGSILRSLRNSAAPMAAATPGGGYKIDPRRSVAGASFSQKPLINICRAFLGECSNARVRGPTNAW